MSAGNEALLTAALQAAVPMWVKRHHDRPHDWLTRRAEQLADIVTLADGLHGVVAATKRTAADGLVSVSTADAVNGVAEAVAVCLLVAAPGQVIQIGDARFTLGLDPCAEVTR